MRFHFRVVIHHGNHIIYKECAFLVSHGSIGVLHGFHKTVAHHSCLYAICLTGIVCCHIHKCGSKVKMGGYTLATSATLIVRMIYNQRHMDVILIYIASLALHAMLAHHLTMVRSVHNDGILHQSQFLNVVQQTIHLVVAVLDAIEIIVAEGTPLFLGIGRLASY